MKPDRTRSGQKSRAKGKAQAEAEAAGKCGAATRKGGTCKLPAGHRTNHPGIGRCSKHGGNTPNQVKSAQQEIARREVVALGLPREVDPHTALLEELARTAGHVQWLVEKVREEGEHRLVGPVGTEGVDDKTGLVHHVEAQPSVWARMLAEERKQLTAVATACVKAGIEERRVRIAEQQGQLIAQVLTAVLNELNVPAEKARPVVRKHLTALAGGVAA